MEFSLGERIKYMRLQNELSQEELGQRLGVGRAAVNKYEKGVVENIPIKTIEKLATIFDVTPQYLLGWDETYHGMSYKNKVMRGVKYFYGKSAVDLLYLFSNINQTGQNKVVECAEDLQRVFPKEKLNI